MNCLPPGYPASSSVVFLLIFFPLVFLDSWVSNQVSKFIKRQNQEVESEALGSGSQEMQIENKKFWDVSKTLLEIRRNERWGELSSIWWVQTHDKSANQTRG